MSGQWWRYPSGLVRPRLLPGYENDVVPVVVIDTEDGGGDLSRLWRTLPTHLVSIDQLQAALREFAHPKPPKPAEPTGLGAVVEDADGHKWVRSHPDPRPWTRPHLSGVYQWSEIDVAHVLSEGVTA